MPDDTVEPARMGVVLACSAHDNRGTSAFTAASVSEVSVTKKGSCRRVELKAASFSLPKDPIRCPILASLPPSDAFIRPERTPELATGSLREIR